jgi:hypothetical protein
MPDHIHLITPLATAEAGRERLNRLLGHFARRFAGGGCIAQTAPPQRITDNDKLARHVRYVLLNPCRAGLTRDPLAWTFSTHRDVIGAIARPWIDAKRLATALGRSSHDFAAQFHAYVTSDPSVHPRGTALPRESRASNAEEIGLASIAQAAAAAMRSPTTAIRTTSDARALFIALALNQGWQSRRRLAKLCGCSERTVRRLAGVCCARWLASGRLCLGDSRLRVGFDGRGLPASHRPRPAAHIPGNPHAPTFS